VQVTSNRSKQDVLMTITKTQRGHHPIKRLSAATGALLMAEEARSASRRSRT
jgi:hypothetical protein